MGLTHLAVPLVAVAGLLLLLECTSSNGSECAGAAPICTNYCVTPIVSSPTTCVKGQWVGCDDFLCSSEDASMQSEDASTQTDGDADGGAFVRCASPLSTACEPDASLAFGLFTGCPPALPTALPGPWCASNPRAGSILGSCGGYAVLEEGSGTDVVTLFMYPADGGDLAAVLVAPDLSLQGCVGGTPDFAIPVACFGPPAGLVAAFNGPGALPGCSTYDAGLDASDAAFDAAGGD